MPFLLNTADKASPSFDQKCIGHGTLKFIKFLIFYTLLVILWGAWVRISHSGDGCGKSWPLCHGEIIPELGEKKTGIEYFHRFMSGVYGLLIIGFAVFARRFSQPIKKWALITLLLTITEALLGAKLVLFGLVGSNDSWIRLLSMNLHLINSFFLVGALTILFYHADKELQNGKKDQPVPLKPEALKQRSSTQSTARTAPNHLKRIFNLAGVLILLVASSGAWAALASTLFPASSLLEGLKADFNPDSPLLLRLRLLHPVLASLAVILLLSFLYWLREQEESTGKLKAEILRLMMLLFLTPLSGFVSLLFLSPSLGKLTHLTFAYFTWICFILLFLRFFFPIASAKEP